MAWIAAARPLTVARGGRYSPARSPRERAAGAQAMSRTLRNRLHELLGRNELRGKHLSEALEQVGREHGVEPFQACLGLVSGRPRSESEARQTLVAIETHRDTIAELLGRDPGFLVAAVDHLRDAEGSGGRRPAAAAAPGPGAAASGAPFEDRLEAELRRSERTGRPLVLALLAPREPVEDLSLEAVAAALERARRDVDHLTRLVPAGFGVILPAIDRVAGERAAARLVAVACRASGTGWCAGVAERGDAEPGLDGIASAAIRALRLAKAGGSAVRSVTRERRRHRRASGAALEARIEGTPPERQARVIDLSAGGLRLRAPAPLPEDPIRLELRGPAPRARTARVSGRVIRREAGPGGDAAVLLLDPACEGSEDLVALLAGLPMASREGSA